ncbi:MAG TPA: hypothetical protein PKV78_11490, partial [Methanoculleus thermophilus]|nr:hypothetical protein [Methanoculleus thermophilus]
IRQGDRAQTNYRRSETLPIQVPMIKSDGVYIFYDELDRERIQSYSTSYQYIKKEDFFNKFYKYKYIP